MGIWNNIKKVLGFDVGDPNLTEFISSDPLLAALMGGTSISRSEALRIPAVASDVDLLCSMIAVIPMRLYRRDDGSKAEITDDPRIRLINSDTGDTLDGFQLKKAIIEDYLLGKGGYAYINRDGNDIKSINYVEESRISIYKNTDPIFKDYRILCNGQTYWPFQFVSVLRNTKDGMSGVGVIEEISKEFEIAYATLKYQLGILQSGGNKRGFLQSEGNLTQAQVDELKTSWKSMYGNNNESNAVVLNKGVTFKEASNTSIEMQLNQNKITLSNEIDKIFHINSDFDSTFKQAILPIGTAFTTALNRALLLETEKANGYFFEADYNETTKASIKERYEAYKTAKDTGWITGNEIRQKENMEEIEGLDTIDVGLGAAIYDINTHEYYVPNTDTKTPQKGGNNE